MSTSTLPAIPFFQRALATAEAAPDKVALVDGRTGQERTYGDLLRDVVAFRQTLNPDGSDLEGERVVGLVPNGYSWAVAQWAVWAAGGLFVPLLHSLPVKEMAYVVRKSGAKRLIVCETLAAKGDELAAETGVSTIPHALEFASSTAPLPTISTEPFDLQRNAFMLFTSGSTGNPKGVPMRHSALASQAASMSASWKWTSDDRILHVLPMHHIHGVVNVLLTGLWNGATVEFMKAFDAAGIWERWLDTAKPQLSLFMAVPTIYSRLLDAYATFDEAKQTLARESCERFRLMVSGSAPLPTTLKAAWGKVGGGVLLERYGMTETGMILSCGLDIKTRVDGHVGHPMPGVQVRLLSSADEDVTAKIGESGEIQVRGDNIFEGYWEDPAVTEKEHCFDAQGQRWFKTGDIGVRDSDEEGGFRVLGRSSVDIIKSGGEKISALEIERTLLSLEEGLVKDCAVVAVPDEKWGEAVAAVIVLMPGKTLGSVKELREILRSHLAAYKLPQKLRLYEDQIPRNAMGKVNKKELVKTAFPAETAA